MTDDRSPRPKLAGLLTAGGMGLILLTVTLCASAVMLWPFYYRWSLNRLSHVEGRAELIVPAQQYPGGGKMSPDGRYMVIGWQGDEGRNEIVLWDMETDIKRPLPFDIYNMVWLDNTHFAINDDPRFVIISTRPFMTIRVNELLLGTYRKQDGFQDIIVPLKQAESVYVVQGWHGLYQLFLLQRDSTWAWVTLNAYDFKLTTNEEVTALLATIPYIDVNERNSNETEAQRLARLTSPDGRYYVRYGGVDGQRQLTIYTREGVAVASASKSGWYPYFVGWAHDSSGVYFQLWISGSAAAVLENSKPMFKLSPLSPEEQQAQQWQQLLPWAVGAGAALLATGVGVAWWRRRRQARR